MKEKLKSRKFIAWITFLILTLLSSIPVINFDTNLVNFFGSITLIYIGGQSYIDSKAVNK